VVFSGGEPTLQSGQRALIDDVRALGFKVKLDTNGTRPDVLERLAGAGLLDFIAMDIKDEPDGYSPWLGEGVASEPVLESLGIVKSCGVDHELRTTVVLPRHDRDRLHRMAGFAVGARRWVLQLCRTETTLVHDDQLRSPTQAAIAELAELLHTGHGVNCLSRSSLERAYDGQPAGHQ
jgi:pyruvate formate lyase activating enzyme